MAWQTSVKTKVKTTMSNGTEYVTVGGLAVPRAAVNAMLDVEARGCRLATDGDDILVRPAGVLTDTEKNNLRRWRSHVLAILTVCAGRVQ